MRTILWISAVGGGALLTCAAAMGCGSSHPAAQSGHGGAATGPGGAGGGASGGGASGGSGAGGADAGPIVTQPTNILVNGGFETGMMCYGEFVQPDGNNDYGFYLSTDSHSGKYALEQRCIGPSCASDFTHRSFVITQSFHMPANQAYKLSVWSKCPAGGDAFWYTPSVTSGNQSQSLQCTGAWASNDISFTAPAMDGEGFFYFYNHTTGSLLIDDVVLTYADGTVPAHTVLHPGTRSVVTQPDRIEVDGKPYQALGFFDVPFDALPQVAAIQGANVVTTLGQVAVADCFNTDREPYPDRARDLGLDVMPDLTTTARLGVPDVFPPAMDTFAPYLANVGFYLADESDLNHYLWSLIDPTVMAAERTAAHTRTNLPLLADLQHAHYDPPAVDQPYQNSEDIYGSEPYGDDTSGITNTFKVFSTMTPRPVWLFDANHTDATTVVPKAYFGVVSGATGLLYFDWGSLDAPNLAAATQAIGELSQLSAPIFGTDVTKNVTAPAGIAFIARQAGGKTYVIAVNPTTQPVSGSFTVSGLAGGMVSVMFESRSVSASGGSFSDAFSGFVRHVYTF